MHQNSEQSSARETLSDLRARFPDSPFLTLGQTALWDEPTKASLRRMLDETWPESELIAAAHDTDYFAKLPGHPPAKEHGKYALVLHDDAKTRGLWSAAGEMSQLFGSEDVSTRALLETTAGVSLHRALAGAPDPAFLLSELTAAWGWAGLIYTHWDRKISRDVPLSDIYLALSDQIDWAIDGSVDRLEGERADRARKTGAALKRTVETFARTYPEATLTDLYRALFPQLYALLLDTPTAKILTSSTSELLRFNRATAARPRFQFVDLFLNPKTRTAALNAYNLSVAGSDIYTLDQFGAGSLPFDLVVPGKGRGTLQVSDDGAVLVGTPQPIPLCDRGDVLSVDKLAELIERELGPECVLIGKAISLLPMLSAEYIIVFHEGASGYTDRTQAMMAYLEQKNVTLPELRPILRVKYAAWDALEAVPAIGNGGADDGNAANSFQLPEFLAQAFGQESIRISEFAACWRCAVNREEQRLKELSQLRSTRDLLSYLMHNKIEGDWSTRAREYDAANMTLLRLRDQAQAIQGRVYTFYDQVRAGKETALRLEREKGDDFRARVQPLREQLAHAPGDADALQARIDGLQAERAMRFDGEIAAHRSQVRYALAYVRDLKEKRLALERGAASTEARRTLRSIEAQAELAKARLARNALQAVHGLPHTNFRPSAWWFPMVDATGSWFRRLTETAELRLEPLTPER